MVTRQAYGAGQRARTRPEHCNRQAGKFFEHRVEAGNAIAAVGRLVEGGRLQATTERGEGLHLRRDLPVQSDHWQAAAQAHAPALVIVVLDKNASEET